MVCDTYDSLLKFTGNHSLEIYRRLLEITEDLLRLLKHLLRAFMDTNYRLYEYHNNKTTF